MHCTQCTSYRVVFVVRRRMYLICFDLHAASASIWIVDSAFANDFVLRSPMHRVIYFSWWSIWMVAIWCFTYKWVDVFRSHEPNSMRPKLFRDWNFYTGKELFIGKLTAINHTRTTTNWSHSNFLFSGMWQWFKIRQYSVRLWWSCADSRFRYVQTANLFGSDRWLILWYTRLYESWNHKGMHQLIPYLLLLQLKIAFLAFSGSKVYANRGLVVVWCAVVWNADWSIAIQRMWWRWTLLVDMQWSPVVSVLFIKRRSEYFK